MSMVRTKTVFVCCAVALAIIAAAGATAVLHPQSAEAAYPGDNGRVAFVRSAAGAVPGELDIYSALPDGSGLRRVTSMAGAEREPSYSPGGTKIAFVNDRDGDHEIYVKNLATGRTSRLTDNGTPDLSPTWSPSGRKIAFASLRGGDFEIYKMNASDGSNKRRLTPTDDDYSDTRPAWSPEGRRIAFVRSDPNFDQGAYALDIWAMDAADGSNARNLSRTPSGACESNPDWSPDGAQIAYDRGSCEDSFFTIWKMDADGSNQQELTNGGPVENGDSEPAWSPDGRKIVFDRDGDVWKMDASDGSNQRNITDTSVEETGIYEFDPNWQPKPASPR